MKENLNPNDKINNITPELFWGYILDLCRILEENKKLNYSNQEAKYLKDSIIEYIKKLENLNHLLVQKEYEIKKELSEKNMRYIINLSPEVYKKSTWNINFALQYLQDLCVWIIDIVNNIKYCSDCYDEDLAKCNDYKRKNIENVMKIVNNSWIDFEIFIFLMDSMKKIKWNIYKIRQGVYYTVDYII